MTTMISCPVEEALRLLSGKWRLLVLFRLADEPYRFNALQRELAPITQKVLTATLRGLESDGLIVSVRCACTDDPEECLLSVHYR